MVEIQPYEFKKKTNIEEHNDIVSKVNEIVDVINDTQMDTINTRLTAVEGDVTALESEVSGINNELDTMQTEIDGKLSSVPVGGVNIGGVKNGGNVTIDAQGNMNAPTTPAYVLPVGGTELGGVKNGGNVTIDAQGNMNAPTTPAYVLPVGGTELGGVKNGGNVTINADGTMNASGTGTGIKENVLSYVGNKLKSTVNGVDSNEVEIVAGGGGVSSVVVTNPSPSNITVNVDGVKGDVDIDTLASGIEVYGSEFPADSGNASAYIKLNDSINTGEIGKYTEAGTSFIRVGDADTRLLADTVELRNEVPDEGCKLTSGANGELLVNGVAMKNYTLPVGGTALGGVKNGGNVTIDAQGNMNAPTTPAYVLPVGGTELGGVKNGGNVTIDAEGNMTAPTTPAYTLPVASANTLGGVKIGSGVTVGADGTINVNTSGGKTVTPFEFTNVASLVDKFKEKLPSIGDVIYFTTVKVANSSNVLLTGIRLAGTVCNADNNSIIFAMSGGISIDAGDLQPIAQLVVNLSNYNNTFYYVDIDTPSSSIKMFTSTMVQNYSGKMNYIS